MHEGQLFASMVALALDHGMIQGRPQCTLDPHIVFRRKNLVYEGLPAVVPLNSDKLGVGRLSLVHEEPEDPLQPLPSRVIVDGADFVFYQDVAPGVSVPMNMSVVGSRVQVERSEKSDIVVSEIPQDQWYIVEVGYLVDTIATLALLFQCSRRSFPKTGQQVPRCVGPTLIRRREL